jgi:hypothetical protein
MKVQRSLRFWAKTGAPKTLLQWISTGVELPFEKEPNKFFNSNPHWSEEEIQFWRTQLLPKLLAEGAVR